MHGIVGEPGAMIGDMYTLTIDDLHMHAIISTIYIVCSQCTSNSAAT